MQLEQKGIEILGILLYYATCLQDSKTRLDSSANLNFDDVSRDGGMQGTERVAEADVSEGGDGGGVPYEGAEDYHAVYIGFLSAFASPCPTEVEDRLVLSVLLFSWKLEHICLQNSQG